MRRLQDLRPQLETFQVEPIAVSADSPDVVIYHRARDGLELTLYADPDLNLAQALGVLHDGGMAYRSATVLGVPLGVPDGRKRLAMPSTLLVDEHGVVRWFEVSRDYRLRPSNLQILIAVEEALGTTDA